MTTLDISRVPIPDELPVPDDETPPVENPTGDFDPSYPGSTSEAPYGFRDDGTPYKRHHGKRGGSPRSSSGKVSTRNETQARTAAALLAQMNLIVVMALQASNLDKTAASIAESNAMFEQMAFNALATDPALCRKILGAGAVSGKAGLIMAYAVLGVSAVPAIRTEIQERKAALENE